MYVWHVYTHRILACRPFPSSLWYVGIYLSIYIVGSLIISVYIYCTVPCTGSEVFVPATFPYYYTEYHMHYFWTRVLIYIIPLHRAHMVSVTLVVTIIVFIMVVINVGQLL